MIKRVTCEIDNIVRYCGKSSDAKPPNAENGAEFHEIDTGDIYFFDGDTRTWIKGKNVSGGVTIGEDVDTVADLPAEGAVGEMHYVTAESLFYVYKISDGTGEWIPVGADFDPSEFARASGNYPEMSVGYADVAEYSAYAEQLDSNQKLTVSSPFVFRPSGGGADVEGYLGSKADISAIYGTTLVWNQKISFDLQWLKSKNTGGIWQDNNYEFGGLTFTVDPAANTVTVNGVADATEEIPASFHLVTTSDKIMDLTHKFLFAGCPAGGSRNSYFIGISPNEIFAADIGSGAIFDRNYSSAFIYRIWFRNGTIADNLVFCPQAYDLTEMFGAGKEPSTASEFRALFPLPYYAYDAGKLLNFTGTGIKTVGFNALAPDGTARLLGGKAYEIVGTYTALSYSTGEAINPVARIFTPSADGILTVTGADAETCVHLVWSGYRNGETAPYRTETKAIPVSTYFPDGMKTAGNGRDELTKNKAIKRVEKVKISDLVWYRDTSSGAAPFFYTSSGRVWSLYPNIKCADYYVFRDGESGGGNMSLATFGNNAPDRNIGCGANNGRLYIRDDRYTTAEELIANAGDTVIYYELAEPVETPIDPPLDLTFNSTDFGTELLLPENGTEPTTTPMHAGINYVQNLRDKLQRLPDGVAEGDYCVHSDGTKQEYKPLSAIVNPMHDDLATLAAIADRTYEGVDLTVKFASEISAAPYNGDPWAWIKARITAGNFSGIHVCDYIPFTADSKTFNAQVAGINTYCNYGDTAVGRHIDFICKELWHNLKPINPYNYNNGLIPVENVTSNGESLTYTLTKEMNAVDTITMNGEGLSGYSYDPNTYTITFEEAPAAGTMTVTGTGTEYPWLACDLYHWLNSLSGQVPNGTGFNPAVKHVDYSTTGVYDKLPAELKAVIVGKRMLLGKRYKETDVLTNANSWGWESIGKLWLPTECEVYGQGVWANTAYDMGGSAVQYPVFAGNMNRVKNRNGSRNNWWLLVPSSGNTTNWCYVSSYGDAHYDSASSTYVAAPVCFRVG